MINFSIVLPAHVRSCVYYSAVSTSDYILALFVACYLLVALSVSPATVPRPLVFSNTEYRDCQGCVYITVAFGSAVSGLESISVEQPVCGGYQDVMSTLFLLW